MLKRSFSWNEVTFDQKVPKAVGGYYAAAKKSSKVSLLMRHRTRLMRIPVPDLPYTQQNIFKLHLILTLALTLTLSFQDA